MNSFQAVTRTVIMLGTLVVGILAWQVYGPPPEKLAPWVNRAVELANETLGREPAPPAPGIQPPPRLTAINDPSAIPLPPAAPLRVDQEVAPASFAGAANEPFVPPSTESLVGRLRSLGAIDAELKPWGTSGKAYRCQCRAANPANPTLERNFDAIEADPRLAVEKVLADLEQWRASMPRN